MQSHPRPLFVPWSWSQFEREPSFCIENWRQQISHLVGSYPSSSTFNRLRLAVLFL